METIRELLLITIAFLQLQFGDWVNPVVRYIGDLLLLLLFLYTFRLSVSNGKLILRSELVILPKIGYLFLGINIAYLLYSVILWKEPILSLRLARQPLFSSIWMLVVVSVSFRPGLKNLKIARYLLVGTLLFFAGNTIFATVTGIVPRYAETAQIWQGVLVHKLFVKGSLSLYLLIFVLMISLARKSISGALFFGLISVLTVGFQVLRFRYWLIMNIMSIGIVWLITWIRIRIWYRKLISLFALAAVLFVLLIAVRQSSYYETGLTWLTSLRDDVINQSGTFSYRINRDFSRVEYQLRDHLLFRLFGYGFVHKDSQAAMMLGFSSETNDTGIVQFILTYGFVGAGIYLGIWVWSTWYLLRKNINKGRMWYVVISVILLNMVLSLGSSNYILWETFYIPCYLAMRIALLAGYEEGVKFITAKLGMYDESVADRRFAQR